jgi:hypothetical protein
MSVGGSKITNVINNDYLMKGVMSVATIEITWVFAGTMGDRREQYLAFLADKGEQVRPDVSARFEFDLHENDLSFCERVFANTNTYQGQVWNALEPHLPANRSHTALSIGDLVSIDGRTYRCADLGFTLVA